MKLIVLHFRQKKLYPPLINMLSFLEESNIDYKLIGDYKTTSYKFNFINRLSLYFNYLSFVFYGFIALSKNKNSVLYYESLSAMPIVVYLFFFKKRNVRIFAHFHEYFSKEEYQRQSFLERLGRKYELSLFKQAEWISHTNKDRLDLFKNDIDFKIDPQVLKTMPNYPSKSWVVSNSNTIRERDDKIKMLYIGSVSFSGTYLRELLDHFGNNDKFEIFFYSHTKDMIVIEFLKSYWNVVFNGSIDYQEIPKLIGKYDVGLVIYKGGSNNVKYSVPNKIFEYLAMDLDVWCSDKLLTPRHYINKNTFPKLIMVDFENLNSFDENKAIDKTGLNYKMTDYYYQNGYVEVVKQLKVLK